MSSRFATALFARGPLAAGTSRWASRVVVAAAIAALVFFLANLLSFGYGRDQGIYAVVADAITQGKVPYRDAWDFKPPAIFFVYALSHALFGTSEHAIRLLETMCWITIALSFALILRKRGGDWRIGFVGGAVATYFEVRTEYWHTAQPESFGAVLLVWALALVTRAPGWTPKRSDLAAWAGAGALFSMAGLLKPPLGGGFVPLLALWLYEHRANFPREKRAREVVSYSAVTLIGAALPVALTLLYFVIKGGLSDLADTLFGFAPHYTKLGTSPGQLPENFLRATRELFFFFSPTLGASLLVFTPLVTREERARLGLGAIVATAFFPWMGVALQGKFFPYHYEGCLPFVCLLAVAGYASLFDRMLAWRVPQVAVAALLALVVYLSYDLGPYINPQSRFWDRVSPRLVALAHPSQRAAIQDSLMNEGDVRSAENRRLADWLRANTAPDASVYLWGFEPVVYVASGRRTATRYLYNVPQRVPWSRESACRVLERDLAADPPAAVAVEHDDRFADVIGDRSDSAEQLSACPWLPALLSSQFTRVWGSAKFDVYARLPDRAAARSRNP